MHTSYVLVLMAYGLSGALGLLFLIRSFRPVRADAPSITMPTAIVMLLGTMTFLPNLPWWYAVLGFLVREARAHPDVD